MWEFRAREASHTSLKMRSWQEDNQHRPRILWCVREVNDRYGLPDLASSKAKAILVQLDQCLPLSAEADGMGQQRLRTMVLTVL